MVLSYIKTIVWNPFDIFHVYINENNFLIGTKQNKCFQEFVESNIFVCVSQNHSEKLTIKRLREVRTRFLGPVGMNIW